MRIVPTRFIAAAGLAAMLLQPIASRAADYPDRAVHLIVGWEAGGGADTISRLVAQKLTDMWGQPVVVENRAGAEGTIAAGSVARAKPDGYTLMMITFAHTITPNLRVLNYDPLKDFAPVIQVANQPDLLLVNPSVPAKSVKELLELARASPGKLNFASTGVGGTPFLSMAMLMAETQVNLVNVNYKGTGPALLAAVEGEVQVVFGGVAASRPLAASGKLRALGITGAVRSPIMPDVPTVAEAAGLKEFEGGTTWEGIVAPANTPPEIVRKVRDDVATVLRSEDVNRKLSALGFIIVAGSSEQFGERISSDIVKWHKILGDMGVKPQ